MLLAAGAHRTIAGLYGFILVAGLLIAFFAVEDRPVFMAFLFTVFFAPLIGLHLVIARGAEACKPWARVASIVVGILLLPGVPIGTALGIWLLSNSLAEWVPEKKYSGSLADGWPQAQES